MKLLHVLGDSKWGGGTAVILALAGAAQRQGWSVDLLATDPATVEAARRAGIGTFSAAWIGRAIRPLHDLAAVARMSAWLRRASYDLVHTHTSKGGFIGRLAATLAGVPAVVHTVHGFGFHEESSKLEFAAYSTLERLAAHCCHRIVTVSRFHRRWALELGIGGESKVLAIPNGIAEPRGSRDRQDVRRELGAAADDILVLNHSRLSRQKGLEDLIAAFRFLPPPVRSRLRLVLAGEGDQRPALERQAVEMGVHALFTGFRSDIADLLAASDIVAMPSRWEGLSISLLEAMAAGKAIVASDIESMREATADGQCAALFPAGDAEALASALAGFAGDPQLRADLGRQARRAFLDRYTLDRMTAAYCDLYRTLTPRPGQAPSMRERIAS